MQKVLARIRELEAKIAQLEELIEAKVSDRHVYTHVQDGKGKLAVAIGFIGVAGIFVAGCFLGWHWGWLVAIGFLGGCAVIGLGSEEWL